MLLLAIMMVMMMMIMMMVLLMALAYLHDSMATLAKLVYQNAAISARHTNQRWSSLIFLKALILALKSAFEGSINATESSNRQVVRKRFCVFAVFRFSWASGQFEDPQTPPGEQTSNKKQRTRNLLVRF